MTRKIIIASHGSFASGIKNSMEIICGIQPRVSTMDAYMTNNFDLKKEVEKIFLDLDDEGKELIVVTDIFGGSINNEFMEYVGRQNFYLISGLNLPLLVGLVSRIDQSMSTEIIIREVLKDSKELIQYCNDSLNLMIEEEEF